MKSSIKNIPRIGAIAALLAVSVGAAASGADSQQASAGPSADKSLSQQIFDTMLRTGAKPGYRVAHAKGIVCTGTFTPAKDAPTLSKAAHFRGASVPVIVRFSNAPADPSTPDNSPNAGPRGMAIRFSLPGGGEHRYRRALA
jgi:catalase